MLSDLTILEQGSPGLKFRIKTVRRIILLSVTILLKEQLKVTGFSALCLEGLPAGFQKENLLWMELNILCLTMLDGPVLYGTQKFLKTVNFRLLNLPMSAPIWKEDSREL